jgi:uncharacterized damage-inducible protein DinB
MRLFPIALLLAGSLAAQSAGQSPVKDPLIASSKAIYGMAKSDIQRSADKIPDELWNFQPTRDVRTVAQQFAHVADAQYEFCGLVVEGKSVSKDIEKTAKGKADIMAALKQAFAYCDGAYAKLTDAKAADLADFFGRKITLLGAMDFNTAHTMEHYGNLVTYMRLKNITPPSSERQQ